MRTQQPGRTAEAFYDGYAPQEWGRLDRHRTEFAVTLRALGESLPRAPCDVLDIGGGPGRYSIELSVQGYRVTLLDISSKSLGLARDKACEHGVSLSGTIHASALDLGMVGSATFDAVLLMGPLYHLLEESERVQAVQEATRVLKPGGRLFATFITRFAPFRLAAHAETEWIVEQAGYARQVLRDGIHDQGSDFWQVYFARPDEVVPLMEGRELTTLRLMGCEGVVSGHEQPVNELQGEAWEAWVDLNYELGQEPALYGASDHLLYIGEKPGGDV